MVTAHIRLMYLPASCCFAFVFGNDIIPMGERRFFETREEACEAAKACGLTVQRSGKLRITAEIKS